METNKNLMQIVSILLHPIFIPLYSTLLYLDIFNGILTTELSIYILSLVTIGTLALPLATIYLLIKTKLISSIYLDNKKERIVPLLSSGVYIYITAKILMTGSLNSPLNSYLIGIAVTLSWILILSRRVKVSLHVAAISSSLGFFIYISNIFSINLSSYIIVIIVSLGVIATARIKLNAHTYTEIATGLVFGLLPQLGFVFLY